MPPSRPRRPARPPRRRWAQWAAGALSLAVLAASCGGWAMVNGVSDAIDRVDAFSGDHERPADDGVTTFLVVGTDDREGIPEATLKQVLHAGGESCHCTDTMMIVQLADGGGRASVVSVPRDSYVDIPEHQDPATHRQVPAAKGRINAAYGMGGAQLTVRTVEQNTGVRIDHYLQVDFLSFVAAVDAVGGVEVCTSKPLKDDYSGLDLPAGTTRLDGAGALKYVRARHVDGSSDLGRMHRQHRFLAQLLRQAATAGTLLDPARLGQVTRTVLSSVKADQQLTGDDLLRLVSRLKELSASDADFATVPLAALDHQVSGWGSTVLWDRPRAEALFDALRHGRPLTDRPAPGPSAAPVPAGSVAPGQIRVQVLNGSAVQGLAARVDADLRGAGFATTGTPANTGDTTAVRTTVRYDPHWDESARTVAAALPGAELAEAPGLGATVQVVAGTDYRGVTGAPSSGPPPARPSAGASPAAAGGTPGPADPAAETGAEVGCP
ncbi:LCP family protein [Kitasatospora sp. NPDC048540]|uniref:LCP family protein n=1 Tax=unclassified Kitasatospora TaxID=2633591 RepID=UPI00068F3DDF|nr:LCP family protein [Kitasatospora sp. MBT63]